MKRLKLFFACLLMAVLSIGQVWADTEATLSISKKPASSSETLTDDQSNEWAFTSDGAIAGSETNLIHVGTNNVAVTYIQLVSSGLSTANISEIHVWAAAKASTNVTIKIYIGENLLGTSEVLGNTSSSGGTEFSVTNSDNYSGEVKILVSRPSSAKGAIYFNSATVTYTTGGVTPPTTPSVTVSPASWDFGTVHASDAASKVFSVSGSNLTAGDLTLTVPTGFSVSPSSIAVDGTLEATEVTVSKNTSDEDDYAGNLEITGGGLESAKTVALTMTVDADPAPTGTFKLFAGDLVEGDYVICSGTKAMKNVVTSSPRIDVADVTIDVNKIENPDESVIWKLEALTGDDAGKWTIYNEAISKYAAFNTTDGRGVLLESVTDYAKWTTESDYDFINVGKTSKNYLRYNPTYGFASYASTTGVKLTLYKKDDGKPETPMFSLAGGAYLGAQTVTLSTETEGATIYYTTNGEAPTSSSTEYSGDITVDVDMTIKAIAIKAGVSSGVNTATYTIWNAPKTVTEALAAIPDENDKLDDQFVEGFVCTAGTMVKYDNVENGQMTYYISADGTETNRLEIYKGWKGAGNVHFDGVSDLAIGDKVIVFGQLINYSGTKEMANGNYIVQRVAKGDVTKVEVSGNPTKSTYASGEDFEPAGLTVTATYASGYAVEVTADSWVIDPEQVTATGNIDVIASYNNVTSEVYSVPVTVASVTLESIALSYDAVEVYQGLELPKPTVTATYSDASEEEVTTLAEFTGYDASTTGEQEITVSYTFGGETKTATYTVTVNPIFNVELAASVARNLIINSVKNTSSAPNEMIIRGIVSRLYSQTPTSDGELSYYISDDGTTTNEVEAFKGKYLENAAFTNENKVREGDEVVVKGSVIYYNNKTPEFEAGNILQSLARTPNFTITNVAEFEVGAADLAVADLTIAAEGEGAVTFASSSNTDAVTIVDGKLHAVAAGTATITANLAADGIYKAATTEFDVTVIAAQVKYTITFDGNDADGGSAPEAIADQAAGASVPLPANTYKKTGKVFDGWRVFYLDANQEEQNVPVANNAFTMPAFDVTIQAQWADPNAWALLYTSNVTVGTDVVKFSAETEAPTYDAKKTGTGSVWGSTTVTVPVSTSKLHFHAVCYGADASAVTLNVKNGESVLGTFNINKDAGAKGNSPFILENTPYEQYYFVELSSITEPTEITFEADKAATENGKRFIIFGVNQEGGILPVLDHIEITGTMTNTTGWKTGDNIVPQGLIVNAYYTLNDVLQNNPVDVTDDVVWSHAPLTEGQTEVTLTASYTENQVEKTANTNVTIEAVETGDPTIITDPISYLNFGSSVEKDAVVAAKTITVTLKNITSATATLGGESGDDYSAFSIDNTAIVDGTVITVSVNTGTIGTYAGTVTIKDDDSDTQKAISLSMTVIAPVVPENPVATDSKWVAATNADLVNGAEVLITGVKDEVTYAIGVQNDNNRAAVEASVDGEGVLTPGENTMSFILVEQDGGTFALRASNGEYLYAASSSKNYLKRQATIDDNAKWTLTATSAVANGTNTHNDLKFNGTNSPKIFSCYGSPNTQTAIQFYVPQTTPPTPATPDYTRDVTVGNYGTICLPNGGTISGAKLFDLEYFDQANTLYLLEVNGNGMEAGKPYIFLPSATTIEVFYTDEVNASAGSFNGLVGSYTEKHITIDDGNYILLNNQYYRVVTDARVGANRAYIHMASVPTTPSQQQGAPRRRVAMTVNGENAAQGFENIESGDKPMKVMIEGTMYILRGEKVYDATGRLVK